MRNVTVSAFLFLLLLILVTAQAIRLPRESASSSSSSSHGKLQEEEKWVGASINGEVVHCKDGHCSGGSRKLRTNTKSASESTKAERVEEKTTTSHHESHNSFDKKREGLSVKPTHPETTTTKYPDVLDLAGMDYSPAKRKPPIHN
ncbi:uncharacterized protein [Aristolochia californica]|uniref:uncharacterized protein n=1 Tax=Aristolochia californica TaxID=171875 RepID=UPI0035DFE71B